MCVCVCLRVHVCAYMFIHICAHMYVLIYIHCTPVRLFWSQKAAIRGFWAGCSQTAEIIPSSTAILIERNGAQMSGRRVFLDKWIESDLLRGCFPGKDLLATFRTGFYCVVLGLEENSRTSPKKSDPKCRPRLYR